MSQQFHVYEETSTVGSLAIHTALGNDSKLADGLGMGYDFAGLAGILRRPSLGAGDLSAPVNAARLSQGAGVGSRGREI
jgi:hypothetical protein